MTYKNLHLGSGLFEKVVSPRCVRSRVLVLIHLGLKSAWNLSVPLPDRWNLKYQHTISRTTKLNEIQGRLIFATEQSTGMDVQLFVEALAVGGWTLPVKVLREGSCILA